MELSSPFLYKSIKIDIMNVIKTDIEDVLIIEPRLFRDARGYFFESYSEWEFKEKVEPLVGYKVEFCQDNESMSSYGVMREGRVIIIPSFFIDKASFHCTHWHRFFPLKRAPPLTLREEGGNRSSSSLGTATL